ncbi:hypothetical protein H310_12374 [Aphanomyces invadans]|uniref:Uncharacterized protein n=1 Tax=Aphanomyces invadans TaxID=157072 RepID=A0A024TI30_9STRA|nr:hypothetical protein H310_12374 [Aphanomyces invadans]ETV93810.1 hypothetical protein H310_12374 [Aphanomyces invadans]|eukprot:XP_008877619.1 hypothetical protein H310_12374 [Aphanomyces invadans]
MYTSKFQQSVIAAMAHGALYKSGRKRAHMSSAYISKWLRVLSNISAGLLILGTGLLVSLLLYQGMFYSQSMSPVPQKYWRPLFQACRLNMHGFIPGSCHPDDVNSTGEIPWTSMGAQLAIDFVRNATDPDVFVTTCLHGASNESTWVAIVLLVAEATFPQCNPVGKQLILGMAVLETVANDEFPLGAYLVSTFSDGTPIDPVQIDTTNSGHFTVDQSVVKTIVATNGTRLHAPWDQRNYVTSLNSLNRLFFMRLWVRRQRILLCRHDHVGQLAPR